MKEDAIRRQPLFDQMLRLSQQDTERFFSTPASFETIVCPACGESDCRPAFAKGTFRYVSCPRCGTLYVNPRPSFDQFRTFYRDGASAKFYAQEFFPPVAEERRKAIFAPRAESITPLCQTGTIKRVGDIGAGFGIFCEELRRRCPQLTIVAIEPEATMAKLCRQKGLPVIEQALEDIPVADTRFDLLTAFELMEHLHRPLTFVEKAAALLNPGGSFLFTTLNIEGFDLQLLWEHSKSISPPHHINFLTPRGARLLLEQAGFREITITTPGQLDIDIIEGMVKRGEFEPDRFTRWLLEHTSAEAKAELQDFLQRHRLSSHMRVVARKGD